VYHQIEALIGLIPKRRKAPTSSNYQPRGYKISKHSLSKRFTNERLGGDGEKTESSASTGERKKKRSWCKGKRALLGSRGNICFRDKLTKGETWCAGRWEIKKPHNEEEIEMEVNPIFKKLIWINGTG